MRKQELIHLHALLIEIREAVSERGGESANPFEAYDRNAVQPTAIFARKDAHLDAIWQLLDGFQEAFEKDEDSPPDKTIEDPESTRPEATDRL